MLEVRMESTLGACSFSKSPDRALNPVALFPATRFEGQFGATSAALSQSIQFWKRLPAVLKYSAGFVYFVSVLGITGSKSATEEAVRAHVERIKRHTKLPVGVGFGIRTPEQAAAVARHADAAVVGTGIVDRVKAGLDDKGKAKAELVPGVFAYVRSLADGVRGVRKA